MDVFGLDWAKFLAQLIVFFVVYFILSKFAFGPILEMLEQRRKLLEQQKADTDRIKADLAETEIRTQKILEEANERAKRLIEEAREGKTIIIERATQDASKEAEQILAKAKTAAERDRDQIKAELLREMGRLVIDTTAAVTGKVLTAEDKQRLNEEVTKELAA